MYVSPQLRTELELDRPARSIWERIFRWGVHYLLITTVLGTIAEKLFGKLEGMPLWAWILVVPYLFFMVYCSNYAVARFVRSRAIKVCWWCLMAYIALLLLIVCLK